MARWGVSIRFWPRHSDSTPAAVEAGGQQRPLDRTRRLAREEQRFDLIDERAEEIADLAVRQIHQSREAVALLLHAGRERHVGDEAVEQQHGGLEAVGIFDAIGDGRFNELADVGRRGKDVAVTGAGRCEMDAAAEAGVEKFRVPAAGLPRAGLHASPDVVAADGLDRRRRRSLRRGGARPCTGLSPARGSRSCRRCRSRSHSTSDASPPKGKSTSGSRRVTGSDEPAMRGKRKFAGPSRPCRGPSPSSRRGACR